MSSLPLVETSAFSQRREGMNIPEDHQASLERTIRIANMVGHELLVNVVESENEIPEDPGVYIINGDVNTEDYQDIVHAGFQFSRKTLSGKADSAHAVLPGKLNVTYLGENSDKQAELEVAAKGCYKRQFSDSITRVRKEVSISRRQAELGEIAFRPVAIVIAQPPNQGKGTDFSNFDVVLVTRLEDAITTLDNLPWQAGFTESNVDTTYRAVDALGRFNTKIGYHGDAKIKNFAQRPNGQTSMIDFETSHQIDLKNPVEVMSMIQNDLSQLLDTLIDRGFFAHEPYRAFEICENLISSYLDHWSDFSTEIQDSAYVAATEVGDACVKEVMRRAHTKSIAKVTAIT